jgi:hypothetical protein
LLCLGLTNIWSLVAIEPQSLDVPHGRTRWLWIYWWSRPGWSLAAWWVGSSRLKGFGRCARPAVTLFLPRRWR